MAVKKYSINAPEHIIAAFDARGEDRSNAIWTNLARYLAILNRTKLDLAKRFNEKECGLILDACNGVAFMEPVSIQLLPENVVDAIEIDQIDRKWEVDSTELVTKLKALSFAERMVVVDSIQLWWNRVGNGEQPGYGELFVIPQHDKKTDMVL